MSSTATLLCASVDRVTNRLLLVPYGMPFDKELPVPPEQERYDEDLYAEDPSSNAEEFLNAHSTGFGTSRRLSTITEVTEFSKDSGKKSSRTFSSRQSLLHPQRNGRPDSTPTSSSYGQVIHPQIQQYSLQPHLAVRADSQQSRDSVSSYGQVIGNVCYFMLKHVLILQRAKFCRRP